MKSSGILTVIISLLMNIRNGLNLTPFSDFTRDTNPKGGNGELKESFPFFHQLKGILFHHIETKTYLLSGFTTDKFGLKESHEKILDKIVKDFKRNYESSKSKRMVIEKEIDTLNHSFWVFNDPEAIKNLNEEQKKLIKEVDANLMTRPKKLGLSKKEKPKKLKKGWYVTKRGISYGIVKDHYTKRDNISIMLVRGAASPPGKTKYNKELSEKRAKNVFAYLTENGISQKSFFKIDAVGETRPLIPKDTKNLDINKYVLIQTQKAERYAVVLSDFDANKILEDSLKKLALIVHKTTGEIDVINANEIRTVIKDLHRVYDVLIEKHHFPFNTINSIPSAQKKSRQVQWQSAIRTIFADIRSWYLIANSLHRFFIESPHHIYAKETYQKLAKATFTMDNTGLFSQVIKDIKKPTYKDLGWYLKLAAYSLDGKFKEVNELVKDVNKEKAIESWQKLIKKIEGNGTINAVMLPKSDLSLWLSEDIIWKNKANPAMQGNPLSVLKRLTSTAIVNSKQYKSLNMTANELYTSIVLRIMIQANWSPLFRYSYHLEFTTNGDSAVRSFGKLFPSKVLASKTIKNFIKNEPDLKYVKVRTHEYDKFDAMIKHEKLEKFWE